MWVRTLIGGVVALPRKEQSQQYEIMLQMRRLGAGPYKPVKSRGGYALNAKEEGMIFRALTGFKPVMIRQHLDKVWLLITATPHRIRDLLAFSTIPKRGKCVTHLRMSSNRYLSDESQLDLRIINIKALNAGNGIWAGSD